MIRLLDNTDSLTLPVINEHEATRLQCMDIWGGNRSVNSRVSIAGLDAWVYSRPFQNQPDGGDIHFLSNCASGRITRLLLADVSGHGGTVSQTADMLRSLMARYINYLDQKRFISDMNRQFATLSETGEFATAIVATFFSPNRELALCNAGHPSPLLYRARNRCWSYIEPHRHADYRPGLRPSNRSQQVISNLPLGILELAEYDLFSVPLEVDDLLLCYTDALPESRGSHGRLLGRNGLLEVINQLGDLEPHRFIDDLIETVKTLHPDNLEQDDVTLLLLRATGEKPRLSFSSGLRSHLRMIREMAGALFHRHRRFPWPQVNLVTAGGLIIPRLNRIWRAEGKRVS